MTKLLFSFACATAVKGALLLLCALAAALLLKRAAARHRVLSLAMLGLLALPFASVLLPAYTPHVLPAGTKELDSERTSAPTADRASATEMSGTNSSRSASKVSQAPLAKSSLGVAPEWLLGLFLLGAGVLLFRMVPAWLATRRLLREAEPLEEPEWQALLCEAQFRLDVKPAVRLFQMAGCQVPITFGILRPVVLLPAGCKDWPPARRRMVLLHELAHVKRRDCLLQILAQAACALHWYNPLAWLSVRLMHSQRELAADDLVLSAGERPSSYAGELLDVARSLSAEQPLFAGMAVAMAGRSQLEGRLRRILEPGTDRRPLSWRFDLAATVLALALLLPMGALHGWAGVPAATFAAEQAIGKLRAQAESHFAGTLGQRPTRVELTLDPVAQAAIEQELDSISRQFHPAGASIVALDPRSGAILGLGSRGGSGRNLAVDEAYEPASTVKVFTVAAALDAGTIRPEQSFTTESGGLSGSGGGVVYDAAPAGTLTVADVLALSSNIGSVKIYRTLGKEGLLRALGRFHFGERPLMQVPAVSGSSVRTDWSEAQAEAVAFGHGVTVSPLQLAAAFAAVANQGLYNRPRLVARVLGADGAVVWQDETRPEQVLKPETARTVLRMLEGVVHRDDGTGTNARVSGYRVAGKTGTGKQTGLFVGAVPASEPRLVLLVVVDGPQEKGRTYYGSTVAAPSFRRVAEQLLPHLQATARPSL